MPYPVDEANFTYDFNANFPVSAVRLMASDTTPPGIFNDDEVNAALYLESSQALYVSGQAAPIANQTQNPAIPMIYSYRRAAALLLDSIAAQLSQQGAVEALLDAKLACNQAAAQARASAKALRDTEANSGNFAIAEMVVGQFAARERVYKELLRLYGSS